MKAIENKKVREIMTPMVITVSVEDSVKDVAKVLDERKISGVGVTDKKDIVGIISQMDIVERFDDFDILKAKDIMTPYIKSITPEATLKDAMKILNENNIHRLLVIDNFKDKMFLDILKDNHRSIQSIQGVLSSSDIIKAIAKTLKKTKPLGYISQFEVIPLYPEEQPKDIREKKIKDVMTKGVIYVPIDTTVREVAYLLAEKDIHGVVVVGEDGEILGVVSDTDIIKATDKDLDKLIAADIMSSPIKTIEQNKSLKYAANLMKKAHIHRLIVLYQKEKYSKNMITPRIIPNISIPVGILSVRDIVKEIANAPT